MSLASLIAGGRSVVLALALAVTGITIAHAQVESLDAKGEALLLEASNDSVPFTGTVQWSRGEDENGMPLVMGRAYVPGRSLSLELVIRKNLDLTLPASHLMEVDFRLRQGFVDGGIGGLQHVLLRGGEPAHAMRVVGASARIVGNSFLFALSAKPRDVETNVSLLIDRKWLDLALIYQSGKRAILALERDEGALKLFGEVFTIWAASSNADLEVSGLKSF